ncbi:SDR family oxidoreductase [Actinocorallia sp. B10E7]|uniref:SDR family oxidoreductase n=1 Tax=Actinocorallia sp. B10E7 TaxID=3153558 RepID=UPI00325E81E7
MRLLVAGMTGQLGAGITEVLPEGTTVVPLLRARSSGRHPVDPALAATAVHGDVVRPMWGLVPEDLEVDAVVNLAGETNWAGRSSDLIGTNVLGAEHGYRLARRLGVPYVYASSIYVAGGMLGTVPEAPLPSGPDRTAYEHSKWLAECRLGQLATEPGAVPLLIARVCALIGNSSTGRTLKRSSLYLLADRWDDLPAGVLPVMRGALVDALPRDTAATLLLRAVRALCDTRPEEPLVCHLGAGETAPSVNSVLDAAHGLDPMRFRREPRFVKAPVRPLVWLTQNADRFAGLSASWHNSLIGLRYVAMERVFPRAVLASLVGGDLPRADPELMASLVFGLSRRRFDEPRKGRAMTMARFPG